MKWHNDFPLTKKDFEFSINIYEQEKNFVHIYLARQYMWNHECKKAYFSNTSYHVNAMDALYAVQNIRMKTGYQKVVERLYFDSEEFFFLIAKNEWHKLNKAELTEAIDFLIKKENLEFNCEKIFYGPKYFDYNIS